MQECSKLTPGWCHVATKTEGPHTKISKRVKTAMQRSKMCRKSETLKRLQYFTADWYKEESSFEIPSRKQPLLLSVHKRCHNKIVIFSGMRLCNLCSCFVNGSILVISTILISNALSTFAWNLSYASWWVGEMPFSACKIHLHTHKRFPLQL